MDHGVVVSMMGMYLSVRFDFPTGAAIVVTFGLVLAAMGALRPLLLRNQAAAVDEYRAAGHEGVGH
jgi:hypothetical protein